MLFAYHNDNLKGMAACSELIPRSLDLTARSIDLAKVLIDASNARGGLLEIGIQIGQWLQHEGLDRHELQEFFQQAQDLALPNGNGLKFHQLVRDTQVARPLLPLFLQPSGSLGRLLIVDPALCWIVSTIGCLFRQHPDYEVTEILVETIAEKRRDQYPQLKNGMPKASRVQLQSVVRKIVSSVWYNIINSGTTTMDLPSCLHEVCAKGHCLPPIAFARVTAALGIQRNSIMVRSDKLYLNLALWLLLHFHGRFLVTVAGTIVLDEKLGQETMEIELRVQSSCTDDSDCETSVVDRDIEILGIIGATIDEIETVSTHSSTPNPQTRQGLYPARPTTETWVTTLPESSKIWTRCTAQHIMKWILSLPVSTASDSGRLGFSANLNTKVQEKSASGLKVLDIVRRSPAILNKRWGNKPPSSIVYSQIIQDASDEDGDSSPPAIDTEPKELGDILPHFPILRELISSVKAQCECGYCEEESSDGDRSRIINEGCLSHQALVEVMILLSHSIADSLGVNDASSHRDKDSLVKMTARLLKETTFGRIRWDTWFIVSSSVLLGCPSPENFSRSDSSLSELCAIQHGNLAAIAGWIDLNQDLTVQGCFSLHYGEGKLGTMNKTNNELQFRGVVGDFLIVRTEETERWDLRDSQGRKQPPKPNDPSLTMLVDDSKVESDLFLVNDDTQNYRLLTRIRTSHHSRLINPFAAMQGVVKNIPIYACSQDHLCKTPCKTEDSIAIYTFDDLLGQWQLFASGDHEPADSSGAKAIGGSSYHLSQVLDSSLKVNVAYALSVGNRMIINRSGACIGCSLAYYARHDNADCRRSGTEGGPNVRFIVNAIPGKKKLSLEAPKQHVTDTTDHVAGEESSRVQGSL